MKTQLSKFALGLALLSPVIGFSQEVKIQPCNTYAAMEEYFNTNPQARAVYEANEKITQKNYEDFMANRVGNTNVAGKTTALTDYTIPVVFHILHQYGAENISDQLCIDALAQMNSDYGRQGSDTNLIFKPFKDGSYVQTPAGYIDSHIKFMLAHKDPQGKCTNGIVHHYDDRTNWNQANNGSNGAPNNYLDITWPPSKYLNIIIVKNIIPQGSVVGGGIIVGYTYRPGTWATNALQDAIVYRYDYLGGLQARSLSHEAGHWLNLGHTFGNTNNPGTTCGGDDGIPDTPITRGNFGVSSACSVFTTSPNCFSSSTPFGQAPYYQNAENIMDYSDCPRNFTTGQTNKMQLTLASSVSGRSNLSTPANLGVNGTDVDGTGDCTLIADWASSNLAYIVCLGGSLNVKDWTYNGIPVSWQWTAGSGVTISSPTSSITNIAFNTIGTTTVTLTVANSLGVISALTRTVLVKDATPGINGPAMESFETGLPANWSVVNPNAGSAEWIHTSDAGYAGVSSYYLPGATAAANQQDYLYMPIVNMQNNPDKAFTFAYSYARPNSTYTDALKVQASTDCGGTWVDLVSLNAAQMAANTGGSSAAMPYFPTPIEWAICSISGPVWNAYKNASNLLIRFNFIESVGNGNNMFIDAVNIGGTVGLSELAKSMQLSLYPNPTSNEATLQFKLDDASAVKINVLDVTGRVILPVIDTNLTPGTHDISINKNNSLAKGIYFVDMTVNGKRLTQKLLID